MFDTFKADREREEDWERAQIKQAGTLKFLVFYALTGFFGATMVVFSVIMLLRGEPGWGHSLAILILGAILAVVSPFAFLADTAGFRGKGWWQQGENNDD